MTKETKRLPHDYSCNSQESLTVLKANVSNDIPLKYLKQNFPETQESVAKSTTLVVLLKTYPKKR